MYEVSRKPPRMDVTIQPTRYFVHKVKCLSLSTDRNQTYRICRACKKNARYQIQENLSKGIHDADEKNLCSATNVPFDIDRTQTKLNILLVNNQRDAAFVLLGLLSLYMFRARFASIFRSNTQNCNGSHQCVSMRVR